MLIKFCRPEPKQWGKTARAFVRKVFASGHV